MAANHREYAERVIEGVRATSSIGGRPAELLCTTGILLADDTLIQAVSAECLPSVEDDGGNFHVSGESTVRAQS